MPPVSDRSRLVQHVVLQRRESLGHLVGGEVGLGPMVAAAAAAAAGAGTCAGGRGGRRAHGALSERLLSHAACRLRLGVGRGRLGRREGGDASGANCRCAAGAASLSGGTVGPTDGRTHNNGRRGQGGHWRDGPVEAGDACEAGVVASAPSETLDATIHRRKELWSGLNSVYRYVPLIRIVFNDLYAMMVSISRVKGQFANYS